eukprot:2054769-Pyramimonas_sp.AAC.1
MARSTISRSWTAQADVPNLRGTGGGGRTSSAAWFHHNLMAEVSNLNGGHSVTVLLDAWKAFDSLIAERVLGEAR